MRPGAIQSTPNVKQPECKTSGVLSVEQVLSSLVRCGRLKELTGGGKKGKARQTTKSYCPGYGGGAAARMAYRPQCGGRLK